MLEGQFKDEYKFGDYEIGIEYGFNQEAVIWYDIAKENIKAAEALYDKGLYPFTVYFIQQAVEMYCKAIFHHMDMINDEGTMVSEVKHTPHRIIYSAYKRNKAELNIKFCDLMKKIIDKHGTINGCVRAINLSQENFIEAGKEFQNKVTTFSTEEMLVNYEIITKVFLQNLLFAISYALRDAESNTRYPSKQFTETPKIIYDKEKQSILLILQYTRIIDKLLAKVRVRLS